VSDVVIHARGLVHADIHLDNIMVQPDGSVVLIDFEQSFGVEEDFTPGLASAAFSAAWGRTGPAIDHYALACLRLALFFPFTQLIGLDPAKAETFIELVCTRFPVPADYRRLVVEGLGLPAGAPTTAKDADEFSDRDDPRPDPVNPHAVAGAILAGGTATHPL
jgi:serine/threonine protein kinase